MSEMVERVAKAIISVYNANTPTKVPYERLDASGKLLAECMARAAIYAMREPTAAMVAEPSRLTAAPEYVAKDVWGIMIGEALKP